MGQSLLKGALFAYEMGPELSTVPLQLGSQQGLKPVLSLHRCLAHLPFKMKHIPDPLVQHTPT
jgi:hypothetical protein